MGTRARRITIEVGGEDVGGGKALRGAGDDLDKLGTKLRGVDDDAKKGFGGVSDEADKLGSKLRGAGQKAGDALTSGLQTGMSGVGTTIEDAGSTASDLFSSGFDVGAIADVLTGKLGELSSKGGKFLAALGAVGVAAGTMFVTGWLNGMETEVAGDKLAAQLGGSEWAQDMGEVAGDLYVSGFGENVGDVATTLRKVLHAGILPEDATNSQIEAMTGKILTFADVWDEDLGGSIQAVAGMMRTDLVGSVDEALDLLTRGAQQGGNQFDDLIDTIATGSGTFAQFGLTGTQAIGATVQAIQNGAPSGDYFVGVLEELSGNAGDAADQFKELGLNGDQMAADLTSGGPTAAAALDQLFEALRNTEDPAKRATIASSLLGEEAMAFSDALFGIDFDTAVAGLGNITGAADTNSEAYDNATSRIESFKRQGLQKLTEFVGNTVLPKLQQFSAWAKENPALFRTMAGIFGGVMVAALAAYTVSAIVATAATLGLTWPIALVALGVAALAGLVVVHFDTIRNAIGTALGWVRDNWPLLLAILTGPIGLAVLAITRNWDKIKAGATGAKDWVVEKFGALVEFVRGLPGAIGRAASGMFSGIGEAFRSAMNWIITKWNNFRFPSKTLHVPHIPGTSIGGDVTFGGWGLPDIPYLADGGIIKARPGGTLVRAAEAGVDEAYVPLDGRHRLGGDTYITENHYHIAGSVISERELVAIVNRQQSKGTTLKDRRR